eukprot:m.10058 g.10058  ORF g.10058 m.10058 type:complete len:877 (+) comp5536_c0_seq1:31-2661(+)
MAKASILSGVLFAFVAVVTTANECTFNQTVPMLDWTSLENCYTCSSESFDLGPNVTSLVLTSHNVANLPQINLTLLISLQITETSIREISTSLSLLSSLEYLIIGFNPLLVNINSTAFGALTSLTYIYLHNNRMLSSLPPFLFSNITNMKALLIEYNNISSFSPGVFSQTFSQYSNTEWYPFAPDHSMLFLTINGSSTRRSTIYRPFLSLVGNPFQTIEETVLLEVPRNIPILLSTNSSRINLESCCRLEWLINNNEQVLIFPYTIMCTLRNGSSAYLDELTGQVICPCLFASNATSHTISLPTRQDCINFAQPALLQNNTCSNEPCPDFTRRSSTYARLPPYQCLFQENEEGMGPITVFESKCQSCADPHCRKCPGSVTQCTLCVDGWAVYKASGLCLNPCPVNHYNNGTSCEMCAELACMRCNNRSCSECRFGQYLDPMSDFTCRRSCLLSPIASNGTVCESDVCSASCMNCSVANCANCVNDVNKCVECLPSFFLTATRDQCVAVCPVGFVKSAQSTCVPIPTHSSSSMNLAQMVVPIVLVVVAVLVVVGVLIYRRHFMRRMKDLTERLVTTEAEVTELKNAYEISYSELQLGAVIGSGTYGMVREGVFRGMEVAVKIINRNSAITGALERSEQEFEHEIGFLRRVRHPHVVFFHGCGHTPEHSRFVVTELMKNGSLRTVLSDASASLPWSRRRRFALDAARGMAYIHSLGKMHRDLKSGNLLVGSNNEVKVADFGTAAILQHTSTTGSVTTMPERASMRRTSLVNAQLTREVGTPLWMAPEVLNGLTYTYSADVYSYGMVLWEIATLRWPWEDDPSIVDAHHLRLAILGDKRPEIPPTVPQEFRNLITSCWRTTATERPEFKTIVEDPALLQ